MTDPLEVARVVSPEIVLKYSCKHYWVKVIDGNDMDYFTPHEPEEGNLSGFIYRELCRLDTKNRGEALVIFNAFRRLIDDLDSEDVHLVRLKDVKSQSCE